MYRQAWALQRRNKLRGCKVLIPVAWRCEIDQRDAFMKVKAPTYKIRGIQYISSIISQTAGQDLFQSSVVFIIDESLYPVHTVVDQVDQPGCHVSPQQLRQAVGCQPPPGDLAQHAETQRHRWVQMSTYRDKCRSADWFSCRHQSQ